MMILSNRIIKKKNAVELIFFSLPQSDLWYKRMRREKKLFKKSEILFDTKINLINNWKLFIYFLNSIELLLFFYFEISKRGEKNLIKYSL